ncbi:zinc finger C2HC domain-containing protein 1A-like [Salmo trutta]|uniref:zinc finger C2HC domain-containing protein 1A-like n=1 Tax=Salmo trutta TaxID=8032 RepID=UPI0011325D8A|nr:zinc finger C2HC domain-containing protein 1A-like [Salmo trutta]
MVGFKDVEEALHSNGELIPFSTAVVIRWRTEAAAASHSVAVLLTELRCDSLHRLIRETYLPICQQAPAKTRKMFDYGKQRAEGTEIYIFKPVKPKPEPSKKQSNWRRKHEDFIATIRATKGLTQVRGGAPTYVTDYVQCPSCQRRFSENAADTLNYFKPPAPGKKANSPAVSYSSSCLPQRSGLAQHSGIPSIKVTSAGSVRSTPSGYSPNCTAVSGLTSPPLGVGGKTRPVGSYGSVKTCLSAGELNSREADSSNSRNDAKRDNDVDNGGMMTMFCHECVSKYPVDWAKF